ncbi:unnamed protein product [Protopolystoma xenopodis]|uniref:Uncharacterized protein n=1 Tax=Protopolystoma xenopodis TaxID=117903 RepID=A0A3S5CUV6_9PLAT|nr:unnamed protein product [Protopolystoma xenopodis]
MLSCGEVVYKLVVVTEYWKSRDQLLGQGWVGIETPLGEMLTDNLARSTRPQVNLHKRSGVRIRLGGGGKGRLEISQQLTGFLSEMVRMCVFVCIRSVFHSEPFSASRRRTKSGDINDERTARHMLVSPFDHNQVAATITHCVVHSKLTVAQMLDIHLLAGHNWSGHTDVEDVVT